MQWQLTDLELMIRRGDILARGSTNETRHNDIPLMSRTNRDISSKRRRDSEWFDPDGLRSCYRNGLVKNGSQLANATNKKLQPNVVDLVEHLMFSFTYFRLFSDLCPAVFFYFFNISILLVFLWFVETKAFSGPKLARELNIRAQRLNGNRRNDSITV